MPCQLLRIASILTLVTFLPIPAAASSRLVTDDVLASASAAAVHGRVVSLASSWDDSANTIYTYVTLDVLQSWGLPGTPSRIVVKQLGGVVGDVAFVVGGQARFEVGEESIVFLDVRPRDRTLSVAGLESGKWTLTASTDAATAMAREVRGADASAVVSRDYRSVAQLHALAALTGRRASAAGAVLTPSATASAMGAMGSESAAYTLLNPSTPARWHEADSDAAVYVDTESGGHPQIAGGGLTQLGRAAAMWDGAGSLSLQAGGSRGPRCFSNSEPSDGRISLTYNDPCGEIADESWTLAIGGAYYSSSDMRSINGVSYWKIVKGMIVTDNAPWKYSGLSTGCYEELVAHELGHAIGFGHAADRPALMYPAISTDCGNRSGSIPLSSDDVAGMATLYPTNVSPDPPPGTPTGLRSTVAGTTVSLNWTPPSGGTAPQNYVLYAGTAPGQSNVGMASTNNTALVVPNVPDGIYYVRVVAVNSAGSSAPTPDATVNVRIAPPGAPENAMASTGPGGNVLISWRPPSTGSAPSSYKVLAGYTPGVTNFEFPVAATSLGGTGYRRRPTTSASWP